MLRAQAGAHVKAQTPPSVSTGAEPGTVDKNRRRVLDDVVVAQTLSQARFGQLHLGA